MTIIEALRDGNLLGGAVRDLATWKAWLCAFRAFYALPPEPGDLELYQQCTGRREWPRERARELWVIAGRRSGKSTAASLLAAYTAAFSEHKLSPGETGYVVTISPTLGQSNVIKRYVSGHFRNSPILSTAVVGETNDRGLELVNNVVITSLASDFRSLRGFTIVLAILDEVAFLSAEGARPDTEVLRAVRPALATTGGPLIAISTPYGKRGAVYEAYQWHYGKEHDPVLVWQAPTRTMNPCVAKKEIERALSEDPEAASAEWLATFRSDLSTYASRDVVEACVVAGRHELPPVPGVSYFAFVDPAGGSGQDAMTLAVAHLEKSGLAVLDCIREKRPPFRPDVVVSEFVEVLKRYGCATVMGDRYAGEWPAERFQSWGIRYEPSPLVRSDLYLALLPMLTCGQVELLDHKRLVTQIALLERRTGRAGKDQVDHAPNAHDDLANAAAGALVLCSRAGTGPGLFFVDVPTGPDWRAEKIQAWLNAEDIH